MDIRNNKVCVSKARGRPSWTVDLDCGGMQAVSAAFVEQYSDGFHVKHPMADGKVFLESKEAIAFARGLVRAEAVAGGWMI